MGILNFLKKQTSEDKVYKPEAEPRVRKETTPVAPKALSEQLAQVKDIARFVSEAETQVASRFSVHDLRITATATATGSKVVSISGVVDSEKIKNDITNFLEQEVGASKVYNFLTIFSNDVCVNVAVNGVKKQVQNFEELEAILKQNSDNENVEYSLSGYKETRLLLLTNKAHAFAVYFLDAAGDNSFSTSNPHGESTIRQTFALSNGQEDEYPESRIVSKKMGHEIMRQYLLTGKMYDGVQWKSES